MSTEFGSIRKKRASPDPTSTDPVPEGDHRKRRRNRTTQSCLNCHTSKRMCDRKRPCGRCTQLGLTGLCVYEVDDPSQRSNAPDEGSRLRQRVAELEGVIRELKNKPHPRWAKAGSSPAEEFEKCHARAQSQPTSNEGILESQQESGTSHLLTNSNADTRGTPSEMQTPCLVNETLQPDCLPSSFPSPNTESSVTLLTLPYFDSPSSASSTSIATPTEEHPQTHMITVAGDQQPTYDIDLASLIMSCPDLLACDEGSGPIDYALPANDTRQSIDSCPMRCHHAQVLDHCGCLNEAASYNVLLELSLRLRKAAHILSHSANHRFNNLMCPLNQKIVDLDTFATTALGKITTFSNDIGPVHSRSRANTAPTGSILPIFSANSCIPPIYAPVISPASLHSLQPWSGVTCTADPFASYNESGNHYTGLKL